MAGKDAREARGKAIADKGNQVKKVNPTFRINTSIP